MQTKDATGQNSIGRESKQAVPLYDTTGFQRDLLRTIAALGEASGAEVQDTLEADCGEGIGNGRLYQNLTTLCDKGFVEKDQDLREGTTNSYSLTDEGEAAFGSHLRWMCSTGGGE